MHRPWLSKKKPMNMLQSAPKIRAEILNLSDLLCHELHHSLEANFGPNSGAILHVGFLPSCFEKAGFFMGDGFKKIKVIPDYFQASSSGGDSPRQENLPTSTSVVDLHPVENLSPSTPTTNSRLQGHLSTSQSSNLYSSRLLPFLQFSIGRSCLRARKKSRGASSMLRLFSLRGLPFSGSDGEEKVELSSVELESLRSELADLEEREAHLKAQLENLDEILRWARLSGYLYMRTRWAALPGEPPPIDDGEVDDWLPRFVVLQGPCLFFYQLSTDLSPQDSTLLTDIVEIGPLPSIERQDEETRHCFYILTRYGLRFECASISKIQADCWMTALRTDCKLPPSKTVPDDEGCNSAACSKQDCT